VKRFRRYTRLSDAMFRARVLEEVHVSPEWAAFLQQQSDRKTISALAQQLSTLRLECKWTFEELTEEVGKEINTVDESTVKRHCSGQAVPEMKYLRAYERIFSNKLRRDVRLVVPPQAPSSRKRPRNATQKPPKRS